jgi:iron(III) transport system substrate-binding protein
MTRSRTGTRSTVAFVAAAILAAGGCSGGGAAGGSQQVGTFSASMQAACKAATSKEGGQLNYWASTDPDDFAKEIKPFQQKYPGIKIHYTSLRPADQVQRMVAEVQAHHALDVDALSGDLPSYSPLLDHKLALNVDWAKLGIRKDMLFKLKGVETYRSYRVVLGLGYNTKLVKPSELPDTWQELVNSKWAGKVIVDPRGVYLSGLSLAWGKDKSISWFNDLMRTDKPQIVRGATSSLEKVISGEALLTTSSHDAEIAEQQSKGAPVAIKYLDVVPTQDWYTLIAKGAKHPNAAACFLSWWGSPEGQKQQLKYEYKRDDTKPEALPGGAKLEAINDPKQAALATSVANEFAKIMANG